MLLTGVSKVIKWDLLGAKRWYIFADFGGIVGVSGDGMEISRAAYAGK